MSDRWGNNGNGDRLYLLGSKITADGDYSHAIKRCLFLGRKGMTNLAVLVAQSCVTLCDSMDCSLPGFPVHGILQARILEWVAIAFSRVSSRTRGRAWVSHIAGRLFTVWGTREAPVYRWRMKKRQMVCSQTPSAYFGLHLFILYCWVFIF